MNAKEKLQQAKAQLILEQPFFGNILLSLAYIEKEDIPFGTMGVDGKRLLYKPAFVEGLPPQELKGVLIHEVLHLALDHLTRKNKDFIHLIWNMACDYVANLMIDKMGMYLPAGALLDYQYSNNTAEEVYEKLLKEQENECPKCGKGNKEESPDDNSDDNNSVEGAGSGKSDDEKCSCKNPYGKGFRDYHGEVSPEEEQDIKSTLVNAYESLTSKERGDVPSELKRIIDELKSPTVDWKQFLRATITDVFQRTDFNTSRGNRNYLRYGLWLPSLTGEENKTIVVAVDTSASVTEDVLVDFASETSALLQLADKTIILSCDAAVHEVKDLNKYEDILKEVHFKGGGGTSFVPVFEKIQELQINPDVLVYLTDGYGSFPSVAPDYMVIWGLCNRSISEDQIPFGYKVKVGSDHAM